MITLNITLGKGDVAVGTKICKKDNNIVPCLIFRNLDTPYKIGENLLSKNISTKNQVTLTLGNIEALNVVQESLDVARKVLLGEDPTNLRKQHIPIKGDTYE